MIILHINWEDNLRKAWDVDLKSYGSMTYTLKHMKRELNSRIKEIRALVISGYAKIGE